MERIKGRSCSRKSSPLAIGLVSRLLLLTMIPIILVVLGQDCLAQSWSQDGKLIAAGGSTLQLLSVAAPADGSPNTAVPSSSISIPDAWAPTFSPDGKTLAFITGDHKLTLLDLVSQKRTDVESNVVGSAAWSPYSKTVAVVTRDVQNALQLHLDYRSGGSQLPPIPLPFRSLASGFRPIAWVPNTDNLVIAGGSDKRIDLYLIDQGQPVRLTSTSDVMGYIVSPDGNRILWARRSRNTHYILLSLYELKIDSRTLHKLDYPNLVPAINPHPRRAVDAVEFLTFAPDLTHFAFVTRGGPQAGPDRAQLWISDSTGKDVQLIGQGTVVSSAPTPSVADSTGLTFPASLPAFSPDGKQLATIRLEGDRRSVQLYDLTSGQSRTLTP